MNRLAGTVAGALVSLAASGAAAQQDPGVVGTGAPEDMTLEVTVGADGPALSQSEFRLALGGYYRFNLICPEGMENEAGVNFRAPELFENAHFRILSVSNLENNTETNFHVQGLNFRQIDCEGLTHAARFSFHPMRAGTYPFTVAMDEGEPPQQATGEFIVE